MKSFSPLGTLLGVPKSSRPSRNYLLVFSLWPTCGAYALITLRTKCTDPKSSNVLELDCNLKNCIALHLKSVKI
jgi:hypothetical protein